MIPFFAQTSVDHLKNIESYKQSIHGQEVIWAEPADTGYLVNVDYAGTIGSQVKATADKTSIVSDKGMIQVNKSDTEWNYKTKKQLTKLIEKAAFKTITQEERSELSELQALRRANTTNRTYEEIIRSAELDRRLEKLTEALREYVNYLPC